MATLLALPLAVRGSACRPHYDSFCIENSSIVSVFAAQDTATAECESLLGITTVTVTATTTKEPT